MKAILIRGNCIPKIASFFLINTIYAITLWPFIFVRSKRWDDAILINHELVHIAQFNELFVVGFYAIYVWDYIRGYIKHRDSYKAYRRIRFEQEAYDNQHDLDYLKERPKYSWKKYNV